MGKIKLQKIVDKLRKLHEWNGHLEINSRQFLLLRTDISQRQSLGAPTISLTDAVLFQY